MYNKIRLDIFSNMISGSGIREIRVVEYDCKI